MKFNLLLLFFIIICSNSMSAQKWQFSVGPSLPIGNFARSDINDPNSGMAVLEEALEVGYLIKEHKNVSLLVKANAERNPINRSALSNQYNQKNFSYGAVYSSGNNFGTLTLQQEAPVTNWSFENHAWWRAGISAGVQLQTKELNKQLWYGQGWLGGVFVISPLVSGSAFDDSTHTGYSQSSGKAYGINYQIKGGMNLRRSNHILDIAIIYSGTNNIAFKNIKRSFYYNHYNGNVAQAYAFQNWNMVTANQVFSTLQLLIGIRF